MPSSNPPTGDLSALQVEILRMAWEGCWYAPCEIVWFLEDHHVPGRRHRIGAATEAGRVLRDLVEERLVTLRVFDFEAGRQTRVSQRDVLGALARASTWKTPMLKDRHLRLYPTKKGIRTFESTTGASAGDWRSPPDVQYRAGKARIPTLAQSIRLLRQFCDCEVSLYSLVRTYTRAFSALEANHKPQDRLAYFWWEAGGYGWRVLRWGSGDEERFFRGYLSLWLDALQLSPKGWEALVKQQGQPLSALKPDLR